MKKNRFTELLDLYLNNKATKAEQEELMELIREGSDDEMIKSSIQAMLLHGEGNEDLDASESQELLSRILSADKGKPTHSLWAEPPNFRWLAAAATISAIAICIGWFLSRSETVPQEWMSLSENKSESAFFSGKQFVRLPDGSTVLLNEGSKLSYATSFGKKVRQVNLVGEGYFDVQHDQSRPFIVVTGNIKTTVLGTTFNVRAYPGQREIKVSVTSGKVQVGDDQRTFGILSSDQELAVDVATNDYVQTNAEDVTSRLWQDQYLILDDVSLLEAATIIGKKYKTKIILANSALEKCRISATFLDGENLDQVLTVVSGVVQASFKVQPDGAIRIQGNGCG